MPGLELVGAVAAAVLYRLVDALRPGGHLVLGPVELALASPLGLEWIDEAAAGGGSPAAPAC